MSQYFLLWPATEMVIGNFENGPCHLCQHHLHHLDIIFTFANIIFTTLLLLVASRLGAMVSASKRHFHKGDIPQTALNYTAPLFFTEQAIFWKEKLSKYKKAIVRSANMAKKTTY